ncbi:translocation/assembly module TamB domain-containing protein [Aromatoleum evansii]|uniref:Translocation/assembly module TamB domain-containing protein n=1 Tax=Aromatoleum evansii TaxID=59406 RepID=A0ABZ1AK18_AROEV|nr:translocation/assembly module TamB domain-containing protein [Aromatoleum evansii]
MTSPPTTEGSSRRRARRVAAWLALPALAALVSAWLVLSESGLRAAAALVGVASGGQVVLESPSGRLAGALRVGVLRIDTPDLRLRVEGLALAWRPRALLDADIAIDELAAERVDFATRPQDEAPQRTPPESLVLPLSLAAQSLSVGRLVLRDWAEGDLAAAGAVFDIADLAARARSDGGHHRIESLAATLPFGRAELSGEIDGRAPFALSANATLSGANGGHEYRIRLAAAGDLLAPQLRIEAEGAGLSGDGEVRASPFEAVPVRSLRLALGDLDPAMFAPSAPRAALRIAADLSAQELAQGAWELAGPVRVENLAPDAIDRQGLPFTTLAARLRWTPERVQVAELILRLAGTGRVTGDVDWWPGESGAAPGEDANEAAMAPPAADPLGRLSASLQLAGVELQRLDGRLPPSVLVGGLRAEGDRGRQSAEFDLKVKETRMRARAVLTSLGESGVRSLSASGEVSSFDPRLFIADVPEAKLNLDFRLAASLGDVSRYETAIDLRSGQLRGKPVRGTLRAVVEGERLADGDLDADLAGNRVRARGAWGAPRDVLKVDVDAPALAALDPRLGGRLKFAGSLSGGAAQPAGSLKFAAEALRLPGDVRIASADGEGLLAAGADGEVRLAMALRGMKSVAREAQKAAAAGRAADEPDWVTQASLRLGGTRRAHTVDVAASGLEGDSLRLRLEGGLEGDAPAAGTADARGAWRGRLAALDTAGRWPVRLRASAPLELGPQRVALGAAALDAGERGRIRLDETSWSPQRIVARGSLTGLAFGLISRPDGRPRRGPGPLVLGAEWDLTLGEVAQGSARVFREAGDLTVTGEIPARLGLEHLEARLGAHDNRLALALEARGSELGELAGAATAQAERTPGGGWRLAPDAALLGSAHLAMPSIAWVGRLMQENVVTGGSLGASLALAGTPAAPRASGTITGRELSLALVDQGLHLSGGEVLAQFDRDRLRLERLEFSSPNRVRPRDSRPPVARLTATPGRLRASGEIALDSGKGHFDFAAERLPILQRSDRWLILTGVGAANSTWTHVDLAANLSADAGYVELAETPAPSLSDDVVILGRERRANGGVRVAADVAVALGDHFYLSALGVDTRLTGGLRLRLRDGVPPSAIGTIATAGGTYRGYGQLLAIERGLINFQGAPDNPGLNVVALRKGLPVEAGIEIAGSARRPRIRLVSEPNVPDPEKLSWIVLGRAPSAGGGGDMGLLLPAAQALLGGPGGGMTEQLSRSLGFDEFSIGQGEVGGVTRSATSRVVGEGTIVRGGDSVGGQVLTLGKRLSSDLVLSFEQSLGGAESLVKLTYQLSRRVSLVARGGSDNAADIYYTISFE